MPKKRKPSPPRAILTPEEREDRKQQRIRLEGQGCAVNVDPQTGEVFAVRIDVFRMLYSRQGLGHTPQDNQRVYDAVLDLERDLHISLGYETPERGFEFVDRSTEGAPGQSFPQYRIEAAKRLAAKERAVGRRSWVLLMALLEPQASILTRWRSVVEHITGERRHECQAAVVRAACADLVGSDESMAA